MSQPSPLLLLPLVSCAIAFHTTLIFSPRNPSPINENGHVFSRRQKTSFQTGIFSGSQHRDSWEEDTNAFINPIYLTTATMTTTLGNTTTSNSDITRRSVLAGFGLASPLVLGQEQSSAVLNFGSTTGTNRGGKQSRIFFVSPDKNASDSLQSEQIDLDAYTLNSEICLLKLLPVKNPVFRGLERSVVGLSSLKSAVCKLRFNGPILVCCVFMRFYTQTLYTVPSWTAYYSFPWKTPTQQSNG